jgi:hypothetical protein
MHSWNLYSGTACGPVRQVILLKRLLLLHAAQSGGDSGAPGNFFVSQVEEIFDGHFRRDSDRVGVNSKPTLWIFS